MRFNTYRSSAALCIVTQDLKTDHNHFTSFKSFSVTTMFQPLWFTPMSSIAVVAIFKALSTEYDFSLYHLVKIGLIWLLLMCSSGYYGRKMKLLGEVQWIPHYKLLQIKFSETTAIRNKKQSF